MKRHLILFLLFTASFNPLNAQSLDEAKKLYLEGRYAEALPAFKEAYLTDANNPALNQWLGACLLETGDAFAAKKPLIFASQKNIPEAYLYLGQLYAKMYQFADAEAQFTKYQRAKRRDKVALQKLEVQKEYAEKLKRAVNRTEDVQIIDSIVVRKSDFLSAYRLAASSGSLLPMKAFFKNLSDDKNLVLYMNERKDKIYYSQGDTASGFDLFSMEKLLDTFGNEKKLAESVNGNGNQAYPFVMPDGLTLYFASTGHQSLGGYDLFVTRYNLSTDSYLTPSQLNMPFNSPFNDYMMAIDEEKGIGWFASDRFQPIDSVCVYTFIPSPTVVLLEGDEEQKARRARISAIKDTWKEHTDYALLLKRARQNVKKDETATGDFEFIVTDALTYRAFSDFTSSSAQQLFRQALNTEKELQALNKELLEKRNQFANSGNETLRTSILNLENRTEALYREIEKLKVQARNEEIRIQSN